MPYHRITLHLKFTNYIQQPVLRGIKELPRRVLPVGIDDPQGTGYRRPRLDPKRRRCTLNVLEQCFS